jgi:peroxiredoxin
MKTLSQVRKQIEGGKKPTINIKDTITKYPIASAIFGVLIIILIIWGVFSLIGLFNSEDIPVASDNQSSQENTPPATAVFPEISTVMVSSITQSSATINWTTDIETTGKIEYWSTNQENSSIANDNESKLVHDMTLTGLTPETDYYFTVTAISDAGYKSVTEISNPFTTAPGEVSKSPEVGYKAPEFSLIDTDDNIVSLEDYNGKWLMISFWETDCSSCRATLPHLQQYYETMPTDKIAFISINYKNKDKLILVSQLKNRGVTFPVLLDNDGTVTKEYKITGFPTLFIIDGNGVIQKVMAGKFDNKEAIEQFVNSVVDF